MAAFIHILHLEDDPAVDPIEDHWWGRGPEVEFQKYYDANVRIVVSKITYEAYRGVEVASKGKIYKKK